MADNYNPQVHDAVHAERHAQVMQTLAEIKGHLRTLNGRTGQNERDIAVLQDRGSDARRTGTTAGSIAGVIGGLVSGFLAGLAGK